MGLMQKYIIHKLYYVKIRLTENIRTGILVNDGSPAFECLGTKSHSLFVFG